MKHLEISEVNERNFVYTHLILYFIIKNYSYINFYFLISSKLMIQKYLFEMNKYIFLL